jgi:hypothetical protein
VDDDVDIGSQRLAVGGAEAEPRLRQVARDGGDLGEQLGLFADHVEGGSLQELVAALLRGRGLLGAQQDIHPRDVGRAQHALKHQAADIAGAAGQQHGGARELGLDGEGAALRALQGANAAAGRAAVPAH